MRFMLSVASLSLLAPIVAAQAPSLSGDWSGTWIKGPDSLPVTMSFKRTTSGWVGSFSSDSLEVVDIPFSRVDDDDNKVHFEANSDDGVTIFDGAVEGNTLAGQFVEHADHDVIGHFKIIRTPPRTSLVNVRDVTFKSGTVTLSGNLLTPATLGPHKAVIFMQGSGPEGRWANRYLAQRFANAGIAALIFDKRGVGKSTGDWRTVGFDALADDGAAGIRFLRGQPGIDAKKIGVYGHSQGGTIAPLVAARAGGVDFVIGSAAVGSDAATAETYSVENSIGLSGLPPNEQKDAATYVKDLINVAYRGSNRAILDAAAVKYKERSWFFAPPSPSSAYWTISRQIARYQPDREWAKVTGSVLLIYGGRDERVPPRDSIAAISAALKKAGRRPQRSSFTRTPITSLSPAVLLAGGPSMNLRMPKQSSGGSHNDRNQSSHHTY